MRGEDGGGDGKVLMGRDQPHCVNLSIKMIVTQSTVGQQITLFECNKSTL